MQKDRKNRLNRNGPKVSRVWNWRKRGGFRVFEVKSAKIGQNTLAAKGKLRFFDLRKFQDRDVFSG